MRDKREGLGEVGACDQLHEHIFSSHLYSVMSGMNVFSPHIYLQSCLCVDVEFDPHDNSLLTTDGFVRLPVCPFVRSFIRSFVRPSVRPFVHVPTGDVALECVGPWVDHTRLSCAGNGLVALMRN